MLVFYRKFRRCITKAQGKAHTPCRAVPWCRRFVNSRCSSRREQAPALRCTHIIAQIGRESKFSAETCILRVARRVCSAWRQTPTNIVLNILMRTSLKNEDFWVTRTEPTFPFGKIGGGGHLGTYIICQLWHQTRACPLQVGPLHKRALLKSRRSRVWNRSFTSAWNLALASMESTRSVAWNQDRRVREDPLRGMPYTGKP